MELRLETAERDLLQHVLTQYLSDLRMEIGKTEDFDMRQGLKKDEETLKRIIGRLSENARVA